MNQSAALTPSFYNRHALEVARDLLGMRLVRRLDDRRISGLIVEAEAYQGEEDLACHARSGFTPRTSVMYGPPGHAYIYFTYGMHWLLNAVTGPVSSPAAVLIRGLLPVEGIEVIASRRTGQPPHLWLNGPAKITRALAIDKNLNGCDLTDPQGGLWIEAGEPVLEKNVSYGPRVGIGGVPEPWKSIPWRLVANIAPPGSPES